MVLKKEVGDNIIGGTHNLSMDKLCVEIVVRTGQLKLYSK